MFPFKMSYTIHPATEATSGARILAPSSFPPASASASVSPSAAVHSVYSNFATIEKRGSLQSVSNMLSNCTDIEKYATLISQTFSCAPSLVSDQESFSDSSDVSRSSSEDLTKSSVFHLRKRKASESMEREKVKSNARRVMSRTTSSFSLTRAHVVPEDPTESSDNVKKNAASATASTREDPFYSTASPFEEVALNKIFQEAESKPGIFDRPFSSVTLSSETSSSSWFFCEHEDASVAPAPGKTSNYDVYPRTTKNISVLDSGIEDPGNDYGWFVDLDDDSYDDRLVVPHARSESDLAFKAVTAPKRSDHEIDVAYAHAADTVDDVLGDFDDGRLIIPRSTSDLAVEAPAGPERSDYEVDVAYAHAADAVDDALGDFFGIP